MLDQPDFIDLHFQLIQLIQLIQTIDNLIFSIGCLIELKSCEVSPEKGVASVQPLEDARQF
jgi:hypothetical protein